MKSAKYHKNRIEGGRLFTLNLFRYFCNCKVVCKDGILPTVCRNFLWLHDCFSYYIRPCWWQCNCFHIPNFLCRCLSIIDFIIPFSPHGYTLEKIEGKCPKSVETSVLNKWMCRINYNVFKLKVWHSWLLSVGLNFLCLFMLKNFCNIFDFPFSHCVFSLRDFSWGLRFILAAYAKWIVHKICTR